MRIEIIEGTEKSTIHLTPRKGENIKQNVLYGLKDYGYEECNDCGVWMPKEDIWEDERNVRCCSSCMDAAQQNKIYNDARLGGERRFED